jgi:hypothetical protein
VAVSLLFSCFSAFRASDRIVVKTFFFVKSLFVLCKNEFRAAVFASQNFVCHKKIPPGLFGVDQFLILSQINGRYIQKL